MISEPDYVSRGTLAIQTNSPVRLGLQRSEVKAQGSRPSYGRLMLAHRLNTSYVPRVYDGRNEALLLGHHALSKQQATTQKQLNI